MKNCFIIKTSVVPVYDNKGSKVMEIKLPEGITPALSRRGGYADNGIYYKGAGTIYRGHLSNEPLKDEKIIKKNPLVYEKYTVVKPELIGKFGIFMFSHQPIFTDYEGGCGKKEEKLIDNFKNFKMSAIEEITDVIDTGIADHKIYAYKLRNLTSNPLDIVKLIQYVMEDDFNSAWDKNLWADVAGYCYVRDLADWFKSNRFEHKLGTVYALLYAIYKTDKYLFSAVTSEIFGYNQFDTQYIPYISALIVKKYCPKAVIKENLDLDNLTVELYGEILEKLYSGIACCHLENSNEWAWVREEYKKKIGREISMFSQEIHLNEIRFNEIMNINRR